MYFAHSLCNSNNLVASDCLLKIPGPWSTIGWILLSRHIWLSQPQLKSIKCFIMIVIEVKMVAIVTKQDLKHINYYCSKCHPYFNLFRHKCHLIQTVCTKPQVIFRWMFEWCILTLKMEGYLPLSMVYLWSVPGCKHSSSDK